MATKIAALPSSPKLCKTCRAIFDGVFRQSVPFPKKYFRGGNDSDTTPTSPWPHHASQIALRQSVLEKCLFCIALVEKLEYSRPSGGAPASDVATSYFLWSDNMTDWKEDDPSKPINHFMRLSFAFESGAEVTSEDTALEYILFRTSGEFCSNLGGILLT